jgi:hypothetical protein
MIAPNARTHPRELHLSWVKVALDSGGCVFGPTLEYEKASAGLIPQNLPETAVAV